jgi:anaerobic magnesium-protoporphyrin IX monomethyl ester cyclase
MSGLPICLVIPPSAFLLDERVFMTLGILRVAAVLEQHGRLVELVDLSGVENFLDAIRDHARASTAKVFGITATTPQLPAAVRVCREIREVRPDVRVILGGPHVTLVHAAAAREGREGRSGRGAAALEHLRAIFDVLVAGDGEDAILVAIQPGAPSLINADDPTTPLFMAGDRLAKLPRPARHLVDVDSYRYQIEGVRALSLIAQLGCPFECGFCGGRLSPSFRRVRIRPTQDIVDEMREMYRDFGVTGFMFYDDELNVNRKMAELLRAIVNLQADLDVEFRLRGFVKSELFTDEQASLMYQAGFRWLLTGFESGAPRILESMNKKATRDDNTRCVATARRHGLKVKALMSIGHPGESAETVAETRDWLLEAKPDDFDVTIITTYPGTPYYDDAAPHESRPGVWTYTSRSGERLHGIEVDYTTTADYYKGDPNGGYRAFVFTDALSCDELVVLRDRVEREVRQTLGIPFNASASAIRYEHSMGQGGLPRLLLRTTPTTRRSTGEPVVEVEPQPTPVKVRRVGQAGAA